MPSPNGYLHSSQLIGCQGKNLNQEQVSVMILASIISTFFGWHIRLCTCFLTHLPDLCQHVHPSLHNWVNDLQFLTRIAGRKNDWSSPSLHNWVNDLQFLTRIAGRKNDWSSPSLHNWVNDLQFLTRLQVERMTGPVQVPIQIQVPVQIPLTSSLLMVLYTEISELLCTSFRLALVSKILLKMYTQGHPSENPFHHSERCNI